MNRLIVLCCLATGCAAANPSTARTAPGETSVASPSQRAEGNRSSDSEASGPAVSTAVAGPDPIATQILAEHNRHRADHCAPPLGWSTQLATVAQRWADHLKNTGCGFEHSRGDYGENLAAGTAGMLSIPDVVSMWYDEVAQFDFRRGGFSMETGHFTQVVWRSTTQVGCGHSTCGGNDIWVCNYDPAGNMEGDYRNNVSPQGCR